LLLEGNFVVDLIIPLKKIERRLKEAERGLGRGANI
jgi:hypothetical protein